MPDFKHDQTLAKGSKSMELLHGKLDADMLESAVVLSAVFGFGKRKVFGAQSLGHGAWRLTAPKTGRLILDVQVEILE